MKLKRRAAGLGGYLLAAGIYAEPGLTWQIVLVSTALVLLTYAYKDDDRAPAKSHEPREARGWMAPREGGYRPQCPIHGRNGCHVLTRHCPSPNRPRPPAGSGGVT